MRRGRAIIWNQNLFRLESWKHTKEVNLNKLCLTFHWLPIIFAHFAVSPNIT